MSINRGMDKKDVVHIYNGILLSHKKELNNAICSNMDGPRDCHTEWSKSDTERQIYDIAYMWNLKKGHKWTYIQNRNRLNRYWKQTYDYQQGEEGRDKLEDWDWHTHTTIYKIGN